MLSALCVLLKNLIGITARVYIRLGVQPEKLLKNDRKINFVKKMLSSYFSYYIDKSSTEPGQRLAILVVPYPLSPFTEPSIHRSMSNYF